MFDLITGKVQHAPRNQAVSRRAPVSRRRHQRAEGRVEAVRILRSVSLLERAAVDAEKQWRYASVILSGRPETFILTVAVTFRLEGLKQ